MTCTLPRTAKLQKAVMRLEEKKSVEGSYSKRKREKDADNTEGVPPWKRLKMRKVAKGYVGLGVLVMRSMVKWPCTFSFYKV